MEMSMDISMSSQPLSGAAPLVSDSVPKASTSLEAEAERKWSAGANSTRAQAQTRRAHTETRAKNHRRARARRRSLWNGIVIHKWGWFGMGEVYRNGYVTRFVCTCMRIVVRRRSMYSLSPAPPAHPPPARLIPIPCAQSHHPSTALSPPFALVPAYVRVVIAPRSYLRSFAPRRAANDNATAA